MTTTTLKPVAPQTVPPLPTDLDLALRRLKLASIRRSAPEVLLTAKTQRWTPEEVLRTLVEAEIAARDASNIRNRLKTAGFPVTKTLESFDVAASSIPANTFDYLSSLEWVRAQHNLALIGPAGTGKSHTLIGLGIAAVHAGHKVRYFTAADLVETLYRGLADNTVGKTIDTLLRQDLIILDEVGFAPLDDTGTQLLFRLVAGAYERRSLAIASHWPGRDLWIAAKFTAHEYDIKWLMATIIATTTARMSMWRSRTVTVTNTSLSSTTTRTSATHTTATTTDVIASRAALDPGVERGATLLAAVAERARHESGAPSPGSAVDCGAPGSAAEVRLDEVYIKLKNEVAAARRLREKYA